MTHLNRQLPLPLLTLLMFTGPSCCLAAPIVWNGSPVSFSKASNADPTLEVNQDRLTPSVWITRDATRGIYNAAAESSYTKFSSPSGTAWAVGTTGDLGSLTFASWEDTVGPSSSVGGPNNQGNFDLVMHMITDDIYVDIRFTDWGVGGGSGGNFAYTRSTAVPEPASVVLVACGVAALVRWRRFNRSIH